MTELLRGLILSVAQPVLALEEGAAVGWNPAFEKRFPNVKTGSTLAELLPGVELNGEEAVVSSPMGEFTVTESEGTTLFFFRDEGEDVRPFLAALGAEIRSQLSVITSVRSIEERRKDIFGGEDLWKYNAMLNRSLYRLTREADDLMLLAEKRPIFTDSKTLDLGRLVKAVVEEVHLLTERTVRADIPEGQTFRMIGDTDLLLRLILNLVSNSLRYAPEGEIILRVRRTKKKLMLSVHDSGVIPPDKFQTILHGYAAMKDGLPGKDGLGLGLSVVNVITGIHDGTVTIESRKGKGTTITVSFPAFQSKLLILEDSALDVVRYHSRGLNPILLELSEVLDWKHYKYLHGD